MREKIIVALDVDTQQEALALTTALRDHVGAFKVGLQLYNNTGPGIVKTIADAGGKVFLDLKFHDIPNTAARAAEAVVGLGAFMFNVHASGGKKMMADTAAAAKKRAEKLGIPAPLLIGVTVLTSMSEEELQDELGVTRSLPEHVGALARQCQQAGLDGVVASAREIPWIRKACGEDFVIVTPGIRPAWAAGDDQSRIVTPKDALKQGADYLVVGRPLTKAEDPAEAAKRLLAEIE
ncbi:orotidine-5'-phosphate decarboxylase [Dethiobacter alkaliphilus]|uniref:Orotidine 5'-phosphate decarboxylase n=1 Tax=Dethiobacter alkaliphilus AHT 1 TaxID=555088 RepID=C0GF13_DETAL|nr:orotidine-5'-phosphate decarboxylase [Dethiobacter alkaliphilus]EEG78195.1 orotidine 5'-phosphate decarboxylase [Dethiobacter alkaliphilus AHT 1]